VTQLQYGQLNQIFSSEEVVLVFPSSIYTATTYLAIVICYFGHSGTSLKALFHIWPRHYWEDHTHN